MFTFVSTKHKRERKITRSDCREHFLQRKIQEKREQNHENMHRFMMKKLNKISVSVPKICYKHLQLQTVHCRFQWVFCEELEIWTEITRHKMEVCKNSCTFCLSLFTVCLSLVRYKIYMYILRNWLNLWSNQTDKVVETEGGNQRESELNTHTGSRSFFLLQAPLQDRQISFGASSRCIWRLLCLSLSLPASLSLSLPLSYSLSLPLSLSPDCSD